MLTRPYIEDPECPDEDDLVFRKRMLESFRRQGLTIEDIKSIKWKEYYSAWLGEQQKPDS